VKRLGRLLILTALALTGCGSTATRTVTQVRTTATTPSRQAGPCIITGAGNKLCGEDAEAWCKANPEEAVACRYEILNEAESAARKDCEAALEKYPNDADLRKKCKGIVP
jgi:hypothetical protein